MFASFDSRVELTAACAAIIRQRADRLIAQRADELYREAIARWAAAEVGAFPTRLEAYAVAEEELEVLCLALGQWAALDPSEVFPPIAPRRREPSEWWEGDYDVG